MRPLANRLTTTASLLVFTLATACSSSATGVSSDGGATDDGVARKDSRSSSDGHERKDAATSRDASSSGEKDASSTDAGARPEAGQSPDSGTTNDAVAKAAPVVISTTPANAAVGVAVNTHVSATFSEAMDPATLSPTTFTLTSGSPPVAVAGTVIYGSSKAVFSPTAHLPSDTSFTATVTTGAKSAAEIALGAAHTWTFTTASSVTAGVPVNLGTASQYVILAKTGISTVSPSVIIGNLGISPAAATYITGFSLIADPTNVFSTSSQVTGKIYAADYASPTPTNLTTAIGDMGTAFTAAAGRAPDVTGLGAGSVGGMTLPAGVYGWGTGLLLATDVTLTGSATDV